MTWDVSEGEAGSILITDSVTQANITQRSLGPDPDGWSFYLSFCGSERYFQVDNQLKSYFLAQNQGVKWVWKGPEIIDPALRIDADWMNWTCSEEEALRLNVLYPDIEQMGQFERNSILVEYVITGLIARAKKRAYAPKQSNYFYSNYEYKKSMGKNYGYRLPSDDELVSLMNK